MADKQREIDETIAGIDVPAGDAPITLAKLVDQFCAMDIDFSDIPVMPELLHDDIKTALESAAKDAVDGHFDIAFEKASAIKGAIMETEYLKGKILFSLKSYYEASRFFENVLLSFDGYSEIWFLLGMANYQMGLTGHASTCWLEAVRFNKNHQDAGLLYKLARNIMLVSDKDINPETEKVAPIVFGKGIDVGCGGNKIHPDAIGVDIIAPGEVGAEASQKGLLSQADIEGSGDDLKMFGDGELDYVIARHNLEHYADPLKTLIEWKRVLKIGGVIAVVLADDNEFDSINADETSMHVFTQSSLRNFVSLVSGLEIVESGIAKSHRSFYTVIENIGEEGIASYDYDTRYKKWLSSFVKKRGELALLTGMNDVASAAFRKLKELIPDAKLEANPEELYPFPFEIKPQGIEIKEQKNLVVALLGTKRGSGDIAKTFTEMGHTVYELAIGRSKRVGFSLEKRLKEIRPDFALSTELSSDMAKDLADIRIPYACWLWNHTTQESQWRCDILFENTYIFHYSKDEVFRYQQSGVKKAFYLPPAVRAGSVNAGNVQGEKVGFVLDSKLNEGYGILLDRFKKKLMDPSFPDEEKDSIFGWIRKFGKILEAQSENPEWIIPKGWDDVTGSADTPDFFGASKRNVIYALGGEVTFRFVRSVADVLTCEEIRVSEKPFDEDGDLPDINIIVPPVYNHDGYGEEFFDVMGRGGFVLAHHKDGYDSSIYEPNVDFAVFKTKEEACKMSRFFLDNEDKRKEIAKNGRRKTTESHSMKARLEAMIESLSKEGVIKIK